MGGSHYVGGYDLSGRRLIRRGDGHTLEIRHSVRVGREYTPTYLHDVTEDRYVSNLYDRPEGAEFEDAGLRYAIVREGRCAVRVEELYRYRKGGSRRRHERHRQQLDLFTT